MDKILNKGKKSRIFTKMAVALAAIMIASLLPISVRAENEPKIIHLSNAILTQAKNHKLDEMTYPDGVDGIEYFPAEGEMEGNGLYRLYEAATYILDEDITLDGEVLLFRTDSNPTTPYETVTLDLNDCTVDQTNYLREPTPDDDYYDDDEFDYYGYFYYGAVTCEGCRLVITDSGENSLGKIDTSKIPHTSSILTNPDRISVLVYGSVVLESGSYKGKIRTDDAADYEGSDPDIDSKINLTINGGKYYDSVISHVKTVINDGWFDGMINLYHDAEINNGIFNYSIESYRNLTVNDGAFASYLELDSNDGLAEVVINGGNFTAVPEDIFESVIEVYNVQLTINDIVVNNLNTEEGGMANALYAEPDPDYPSSIVINGGIFTGGNSSAAVLLDNVSHVEIKGGYFMGYDSGLEIRNEADSNVILSGGVFSAFGESGNSIKGGISYVFPKEAAKESYGNDALDFLLAKGYCYNPEAQISFSGVIEGSEVCTLYTQKTIEVVPISQEANTTPQTGDKGVTSMILLASVFAAAGASVLVYKKKKYT